MESPAWGSAETVALGPTLVTSISKPQRVGARLRPSLQHGPAFAWRGLLSAARRDDATEQQDGDEHAERDFDRPAERRPEHRHARVRDQARVHEEVEQAVPGDPGRGPPQAGAEPDDLYERERQRRRSAKL